MKLRTVLVNRFVTFAVGLALLGLGAFALAWVGRVPFTRDSLARLDRPRVIDVPDQPWWTAALWGAVAVGLTVGIVLLVVNLSRRRTSTVSSARTSAWSRTWPPGSTPCVWTPASSSRCC